MNFRLFKLGALAFAASTVLGVAGHAQAQRVSHVNGQALGAMCSQAKSAALCDAYLSGVMDSEVWSRDYAVAKHDPKAPVAFCVPPAQTAPQVRNVVVAWLGAHREHLTQPAGKDVYLALHDMYPCPAQAAPQVQNQAPQSGSGSSPQQENGK